ncbi:sulfotransferase domain-containing protein [Salinibacter ruber]|jgi:hypothetical protein|uniref:Sulfotransferase domain-containing protein n=1 Tax=Salinibacter ruber TaxID=146919 RepID=A0A9X2UJW3_9BACT|nr:sulfotransferase domain-containing protein [Salinibacter ruber]MCS3611790.1 hypothetical protein [Salinibacter ruber]MCS3613886.1 hypothetical protein [Salinibacter ruber]MCS3645756.1 hypothetical protein [Salinibacter ruber]MCS3673501.1 hypothetical protein [Salinibacter ruber]MCS3782737.1 hypothetical protein [Salinibacter ruber]
MNFVASYPKSGNTWIRMVVAAYSRDSLGASDFIKFGDEEIFSSFEWIDASQYNYQPVSTIPLSNIDLPLQVRLRAAAMLVLEREVEIARRKEETIVVKSHHLHGTVNGFNLWSPEWTDCVVNPVRDPREICCSFAAHLGEDYADTAAYMARSKAQIASQNGLLEHLLGAWSTHVRSWTETEEVPVYTVRYEDMKTNPVETFYDVLNFLNVSNLSMERVERANEKTRFDKVKKAEQKHGRFPESGSQQDQFFRSGQTDGWREELPSQVARKIESDHGEMMEKLGYL